MLSVRSSFRILVTLLLAGCVPPPTGIQPASTETTPVSATDTPPSTVRTDKESTIGGQQAALSGTEWALVQLRDRDLSQATTISLRFTADEFRGFAGCNEYWGAYSVDGNRITIHELQSTLIGCSERVWDQAEEYHTALAYAATYRLADDRLEIFDHTGATLLVLAPEAQQPKASLEGPLWVLDHFVEREARGQQRPGAAVAIRFDDEIGGNAAKPPAQSRDVTVHFADGEITGNTHCNSYTGLYELDGSSLAIKELTWTKNPCWDNDSPGTGEADYLEILQNVATYEFRRRHLTLWTADGRGLGYTPTEGP